MFFENLWLSLRWPEEIERKFLVKSLPLNLNDFPLEHIIQGYDNDGKRLRKKGDEHSETIKIGGGRVRLESSVEITENQFNSLWPKTEGRRIEKTRYKISHGADTIELDVYRGDLEGLYLVEIEFDTFESSEKFSPPEWFGREITEDEI